MILSQVYIDVVALRWVIFKLTRSKTTIYLVQHFIISLAHIKSFCGILNLHMSYIPAFILFLIIINLSFVIFRFPLCLLLLNHNFTLQSFNLQRWALLANHFAIFHACLTFFKPFISLDIESLRVKILDNF